MEYNIFRLTLGSYLEGYGNRLPFLTSLSGRLFERLSEALEENPGNVLIAHFPEKIDGTYGKVYEVPMLANYTKIYDHVVEHIGTRKLFVEGILAEDLTKDSCTGLRVFMSANEIGIVITDFDMATELYHALISSNETVTIQTDAPLDKDGEFNLSAWNSWRAYCWEMQFENEAPLVFAGLREGFFASMDGQKRPENRAFRWTNRK